MKRLLQILLVSASFIAFPALAVTGNVNAFLGQKTLDSNDWDSPYDEQGEFGVLFDIRGDTWPVSLAVDLLGSAHTESTWLGDLTASTSELDLGVRKVFDFPNSIIHPYFGGGLALVGARVELVSGSSTYSIEDSGVGVWLNGGVYWTLGGGFNLGIEARYSEADVTFNYPGGGSATVNAGGSHGGILLGYHW